MRLKPGLFALLMLLNMALWTSCNQTQVPGPMSISSPDGKVSITIGLDTAGTAYYSVAYGTEQVIKPATLGFDFKGMPALKAGLSVVKTTPYSQNQKWAMPWGEQDSVQDHFNGVTVQLKEKAAPHRMVNLHFKAYNDGIGFRYEFPKQEGLDTLVVMDENTQFNLTGDHTCWWAPGDWDIYEHLYNKTPLSKVNATVFRENSLPQSHIPDNAMNTPVTMRTASGLHLSFHEANLTNYPGMTLKVDTTALSLTSGLVASKRYGHKAKVALPFNTPWRTIQISPDAAGLIASKLILNLNEPNQLGDVSWVKPMKYIGIWWHMHIRTHSWAMEEGKKHGATTELAKRYIDFAAENGFGGVLVEGWNTGWEKWKNDQTEGIFDFVTPYPD